MSSKTQLPTETVNKILQYLITKPYQEVAALVSEIQATKIIIKDEQDKKE